MGVQENLDLVRRAYAAFSAGDVDTLSNMLASDAVHTVPGKNPISGSHKGVEDILAMYGELFTRSDGTIKVVLEDVLSDGGDRVVAIHRSTAEREGRTISQREALLFTIANGKAVDVQDFWTDIDEQDDFWA